MSSEKLLLTGNYIVSLMRSALRGEPPAPAPDGLDWKYLFSVAKAHMVCPTIYRAAEKSDAPQAFLTRVKAIADNHLRVELLYDAERARLCRLFDEAGIDYLPLKGVVLNGFYPHKGMRQFSDNDILFDKRKRRAMKKLMLAQGYSAGKDTEYSAHDVYQKPPVFNFEMHRALMNRSLNLDYFKKIWSRAVKEGSGRAFRMTNEDFYLFNLAHFHKHYTHGGAGLRFFSDLYLLEHKLPYDRAYVERVAKELGMEEFRREMIGVAEGWFGDEPHSVPEETAYFVFSSGAYGTLEHSAKTQVEEGTGIFRYIFLPFKEMKARFPFLKYLPFLLPFCWLFRMIRAVFSRKKIQRARLVAKYSREAKKE